MAPALISFFGGEGARQNFKVHKSENMCMELQSRACFSFWLHFSHSLFINNLHVRASVECHIFSITHKIVATKQMSPFNFMTANMDHIDESLQLNSENIKMSLHLSTGRNYLVSASFLFFYLSIFMTLYAVNQTVSLVCLYFQLVRVLINSAVKTWKLNILFTMMYQSTLAMEQMGKGTSIGPSKPVYIYI